MCPYPIASSLRVRDYCQFIILPLQSTYSNVVIHEGSEPENFFWVAMGGKSEYEEVSPYKSNLPPIKEHIEITSK